MDTLRVRPAIVLAALLVAVWFVVPALWPDQAVVGLVGSIVAGLLIMVWWLFFSRAPWIERLVVLALIGIAVVAIRPLVHPSVRGAGMGVLFYMFSIPAFALGLAAAAFAARRRPAIGRRATLLAGVLAAAALLLVLRTEGVTGDGRSQFHLRWTPTAEQRLVAAAAASPASGTTPSVATPGMSVTPVRWPGFRGHDRNSVAPGVRIDPDWSRSPPAELWRRPVGPGWSSFAVAGDLIYTQEQRGDQEIVAAYRFATGEPVWAHDDTARFYESNGGPGPRSTPLVHGGRVYSHGATGILNALDAGTGDVVWSRNTAKDAGKTLPGWGFSSSAIIVDDMVVVAAAGRVIAYDRERGTPRWIGPDRGGGYSSPHLLTIGGVPQIVHMGGTGAAGLSPADGNVLWHHPWEGTPIVQPSLLSDGDLLLTTADMMGGVGIRRVGVTQSANGWTVEVRWTSRSLKPYFNDYVIHEGHAYGFDGNILACVDLNDGARKWKGGRYGNGQMILLPDQDLLIVLSEDGELALVNAQPDMFTEIARVNALNAKTWNHPVLVDDVLLARNGEEMVAYRLASAR